MRLLLYQWLCLFFIKPLSEVKNSLTEVGKFVCTTISSWDNGFKGFQTTKNCLEKLEYLERGPALQEHSLLSRKLPHFFIETNTYPNRGSRAMARGDSISPAISVRRKLPLSRATSIWSRLLSTQYRFSPIQSTANPSAVDSPVCTTTSMFPRAANKLHTINICRKLRYRSVEPPLFYWFLTLKCVLHMFIFMCYLLKKTFWIESLASWKFTSLLISHLHVLVSLPFYLELWYNLPLIWSSLLFFAFCVSFEFRIFFVENYINLLCMIYMLVYPAI